MSIDTNTASGNIVKSIAPDRAYPPTAVRTENRFASSVAASWKPLVLLFLVGFTVRVGWVFAKTAVIENDGAEYARIAENLLQGRGYVGTMGAPQLTYAPLYPVLIALLTPVFGNSEVAGRFIA